MPEQVIVVTLQTFSTTGGIQKMTRTLGYSINKLAEEKACCFEFWSLYDSPSSLITKYVPADKFKGFSNSKLWFMVKTLVTAKKNQHIILTHINLSLVGVLAKMVNSDCKVYLIAHGIEVWRPLSRLQKLLLEKCDQILSVSSFTQEQMVSRHQLPLSKMQVLNNALDPYIQLPATFEKPKYLLERYKVKPEDKIIFTLTRLASTEQYKGYEQVIMAVSKLKSSNPNIKYILAGQYDAAEEERIHQLIARYDVEEHVQIIGFVHDEELTDHFLLADLFVLPSKKEGFGLVFIEALACGLPVISGNADGSIDAIKHGELGKSVNADSVPELEEAIDRCLAQPLGIEKRRLLQKKCTDYFNELQYRNQLKRILFYDRNSA